MIAVMEYGTRFALEQDLVEAVRDILRCSPEPMSLPKIHAALPPETRAPSLNALANTLDRQVAAQVLYLFPRYRSAHERYWDRPINVHLAHLLRGVLERGPLSWSELRRRLPDYAKLQAEGVLQEELARGRLFLHPPLSPRLGPRYGLQPACPLPYARQELDGLFRRLGELGFSKEAIRSALLKELEPDSTPRRTSLNGVRHKNNERTLIPESMF